MRQALWVHRFVLLSITITDASQCLRLEQKASTFPVFTSRVLRCVLLLLRVYCWWPKWTFHGQEKIQLEMQRSTPSTLSDMNKVAWFEMSLNVGEPTIVCPYPETAIDLKNGMSMSSWDQECLHWLYFALVVKAEQNQLWQLLIAYDHFKRKILQVSCMWINIKSSGKFQNMSLQWVPRGRTSPMRKNERGERSSAKLTV